MGTEMAVAIAGKAERRERLTHLVPYPREHADEEKEYEQWDEVAELRHCVACVCAVLIVRICLDGSIVVLRDDGGVCKSAVGTRNRVADVAAFKMLLALLKNISEAK